MNWITIVWSMVSAVCFTFAAIYLVAWFMQIRQLAYLIFSTAAGSAGAVALFELGMMHAETPMAYGILARWGHVPVFFLVVGIVGFIRLYLGVGRLWLLWTVCASRMLVLVVNFASDVSINYSAISGIRRVQLLGNEWISVAEVVTNPWTAIGSLSVFLMVVFAADAAATTWRRCERRSAVLVPAAVVLFTAINLVHSALIHWGVIRSPYLISFTYLLILIVMARELGFGMLRAARLMAQVQESEQRMELATDAANLGVWSWEIGKDDIWVTDRTHALLGFDGIEPVTLSKFIGRMHPDDRDRVRGVIDAALKGKNDFEAEYRVQNSGNGSRWITARGRVERDEADRAVRMRGIVIDVTRRKEAEERAKLVVEAAPNAMIMADKSGLITLINTEAELVFHYPRHELLGMPLTTLLPDLTGNGCDGVKALNGHPRRASAAGAVETFGRRKDGSAVSVEVGLTPIHTNGDLFMLASIIDVTHRKRAEHELAMQRSQLAHLSRAATLGELSGSIAHELNQPLASILSNAQAAQRFLAQQPPNLDEVREILADVVEQDKRAGEVIYRLRMLLQNGEVQLEPVDLNAIVHEVIRLIRSDLINHHVHPTLDLSHALPAVLGNAVQLQQVLLNLVMNACDAMSDAPESDRRLVLRTARADDDAALVSIIDVGKGVPVENQKYVFDAFFTTKPSGLGLGLAVCRTIVQAHGGRIWIANNDGPGASASFTIPIAVTAMA